MLSVALATHNEAEILEKCLEAVKSFADEIIIADGASTDETVAIAKKFGAQIIATTNKENFHINKQMAMDKAKGDLVLQLDADEIVDHELAAEIIKIHKTVVSHSEELPAAWWIARKNYFLGTFLRKGGQYPDKVIRLYQRGKARLPQKDVHEQMEVAGVVGDISGHLLHYSNPSFAVYLRKFNTYTSFKAQQLFEAGVKISVGSAVQFLCVKPLVTFFSLYLRHRGYVDGWAGFVFALMSGCHHQVAFLKLWEKLQAGKS